MKNDVLKASEIIPSQTHGNIKVGVSQDAIEYSVSEQRIVFPYRFYYYDVADIEFNKLTPQQQMILHCLYSRSNDGFIRQKHIHSLLQMEYEEWAIPYIVKVCDEYVVEIIEMIYHILKGQDTRRFKQFCLENEELTRISYMRMVSYWNEFYRNEYFRFREYIGRKLFRECFGYTRSYETKKLEGHYHKLLDEVHEAVDNKN